MLIICGHARNGIQRLHLVMDAMEELFRPVAAAIIKNVFPPDQTGDVVGYDRIAVKNNGFKFMPREQFDDRAF